MAIFAGAPATFLLLVFPLFCALLAFPGALVRRPFVAGRGAGRRTA